jgi:hypothetical protein
MGTISKSKLQQMKQVDVRTVDRDTLMDIRDVQVDRTLPRGQRFADFLRQIGNPYCYRCGKAVVKISFADTDATLEDRLEHYLKTL